MGSLAPSGSAQGRGRVRCQTVEANERAIASMTMRMQTKSGRSGDPSGRQGLRASKAPAGGWSSDRRRATSECKGPASRAPGPGSSSRLGLASGFYEIKADRGIGGRQIDA